MSTSEYRAPQLGTSGAAGCGWISVREIPADVWALIGLTALAALIRLLVIDNQSFWMDEALTAYETHSSFGGMLGTVAHVETTPPLYFVLIWAWAHVFGSGEVGLRSLSTLAGIALVPIAFVSARELFSRWAGVLAAAFVAVNPFLVWYSQEARAYMLLAALSGASFLWFNRARENPTGRNLAWWTACSSLAVMTHFFAGFLVAPEALWLLWVSRSRAAVGCVGASWRAVQAAMLPLALTDTAHGTSWIARVPKTSRLSTMVVEWSVSLLNRRVSVAAGLAAGAAFVALIALLIAVGADRRTRAGVKVAASIAGFVVLAPLVLGVLGQDYFLSRNEIPAVVPIAALRGRRVRGATRAGARHRGRDRAADPVLVGDAAGPDAPVSATAGLAQRRARARAGPDDAGDLRRGWHDGRSAEDLHATRGLGATAAADRAYRRDRRGRRDQAARPRGRPDPGRDGDDARLARRAAAPCRVSLSPPGARLIARFRVDNWIVARFALAHPIRVSIKQLISRAPRYFRATPRSLLLFFQQPGR